MFVHGSVVQEASNAKEWYGLFEQGSASRHVASTSKSDRTEGASGHFHRAQLVALVKHKTPLSVEILEHNETASGIPVDA